MGGRCAGCLCRATGVRGTNRAPPESLVCQRSGRVRGSSHLERRPSSPGLDHGLCVYSKFGNLAAVGSLLFETAETAFCSSHTKKMSTVFASFFRCSHRFYASPAKLQCGATQVAYNHRFPLTERSFCADTRAGTAHAHWLMTWFNVNGTRQISPRSPPAFKSRNSCRLKKRQILFEKTKLRDLSPLKVSNSFS